MKRKEAIVFISLLLFSLLPNAVVMWLAADVSTVGQRIWYAVTTLALYGFGMVLLHRRAYLYILSLGFIFSAFEVMHVVLRGRTTTMLCLYTLFKTPPEYLGRMMAPHIGWFVGAGVLWILYYVAAHRWVEREWIGPWRWRLPIAAACFALFMLSPVSVCPTHVLSQLSRIGVLAVHIERMQPVKRAFSYGIRPNSSKADETVIVVLGETSYEQWQALEYNDSLTVCFDSVYAESPVCGIALPMLLSRATAENKAPFFAERSVIRAFDEAGFFTAWLSNYGYHDHLLMRIADDCRYLMYRPEEPDTALLDGFRVAMSQPAQRHMVVMATQGGCNRKTLGDTPYLLRQLTDSLRTTHMPAMLIYAGCPNISLSNGSLDLHMPFMIWTNPNYRYRHRPLIRALQEQRNMCLSADCIFHTLLYMNDISCGQLDSERALGNKQMVPEDTIRYLDENLRKQVLVP